MVLALQLTLWCSLPEESRDLGSVLQLAVTPPLVLHILAYIDAMLRCSTETFPLRMASEHAPMLEWRVESVSCELQGCQLLKESRSSYHERNAGRTRGCM